MERYNVDYKKGLDNIQIDKRKKENLVNYDTTVKTKSIKSIIMSNIFTLFNLLNVILAILIFVTGSYKNMLFMGVVLCNTFISIFQEIRSKLTIDKLSVVSATKQTVIRNGKEDNILINEIVLDDILYFKSGNQVVTDSIIKNGEVEVNESFITGEQDTVYKTKGDMLLSGSFIVSGNCYAKVEHIGNDNYTAKIYSEAKKINKVKSEMMDSLNKIIKVISILIIPIGIILFLNQLKLDNNVWQLAIVNTVAALIGMIPEGLVLLTSTVLAVSVIRLSKSKVLVQDLFCIENLARVDTLCLDKTGTITEGRMEVYDLIEENKKKDELEKALSLISKYSPDENVTINAIKQKYNVDISASVKNVIPFNSEKKWSGISFEKIGTYILGAPEFVIKNNYELYKDKVDKYSKENRVLVIAYSKNSFNNKEIPDNIEVCGFLLIRDVIRKEANKTLKYFEEQNVDIKIISGDNPLTVSNISKRAEIKNYDKYIDLSCLKTKEEIFEAVKKYTIFGRVSPIQKKEIIESLKKQGHTVAMTGDGVNDVLALKEADCSIAMASGSDACRNVSKLVLLDSNFKSMPKIVAEGRRSINNIQRSAQLFLVKTIYSFLLAIIFIFLFVPYPFKPIQLTLISTLTIGIPSFVLALQPNKERVKGHFLSNVLKNALPTGLTVVFSILAIVFVKCIFNLPDDIYSTFSVISTAIVAFILLFKLCRPFNLLRTSLFLLMLILFITAIILFNEFFYIYSITNYIYEFLIIVIVTLIINMLLNIVLKRIKE